MPIPRLERIAPSTRFIPPVYDCLDWRCHTPFSLPSGPPIDPDSSWRSTEHQFSIAISTRPTTSSSTDRPIRVFVVIHTARSILISVRVPEVARVYPVLGGMKRAVARYSRAGLDSVSFNLSPLSATWGVYRGRWSRCAIASIKVPPSTRGYTGP
ncbi:hypothetical protein PM082_007625 [Marasmius tenuissimus]|nr:hypothetical protein PM082_007625 [Marasmius tenuissimus]